MRLLQKALTFDDVLLVPAYSNVLPADTSLKTRLTRNISLNIPLLSAAMDTVTEARLAIAMAQEGGIGIIHKNLTPKEQAAEVARVKRFEAGVLRDPITIPPDMKIRDVIELTEQYGISGFPVVEGKTGGRHHHQPRPALRRRTRRRGARQDDAARKAGVRQGRRRHRPKPSA